MDFKNDVSYTIELWSATGVKVADISSHVHNRSYTIERNEAEQLTFDLDLYDWQNYCATAAIDPALVLTPYQSDVKVLRNGVYLFGTQIVAHTLNIGTDYTMSTGAASGGAGSFNPTVSVTCTGYLNLFKDRYITATYSGQERCYVAGNLLTLAQAATNGSVGVTLGTLYSTGVTDDTRTYSRDNVKTQLQNLTQLPDARFDFSFDSNRVFRTWQQIGSRRTDVSFTYGGAASNIIGLYLEQNASGLFNEVDGLGSGFGPDQLVSTQGDTASQLNNYLRQDIRQYNSVTIQDTLDKDAKGDLALEKDLLVIPQITISGKELVGLTSFLSVGDRIPLNFVGNPFLARLPGFYRLEKMVVSLDDNDFEQEIRLYFDNFAVGST